MGPRGIRSDGREPLRVTMDKQLKFKVIEGGARELDAPVAKSRGTSWIEYVGLFCVSAIIWVTLGYWIWRAFRG